MNISLWGDPIKLTTQEFNRISQFMKANFGINLTDKKRTLIETRLQKTMNQRSFLNYNAYFDCIVNDKSGKEATTLLNLLTTNHTYFLREVEHFEFLKKVLLPQLFEAYKYEKDLRIWSAGCSSGQEPYTIAMIVSEYIDQGNHHFSNWNRQMLATDISEKALHKAITGIYSKEEVKDVPYDWLQKYFTRSGNAYAISRAIKEEITFRKFNLMNATYPFKKKFHVIFCRNVMIYFDAETKNKIINHFYHHLEPGGYLLIGHSEFVDRNVVPFDYIKPAVYRKPGGSHD
ncbi:MAG: protein-glutamate O-methyltransferase CheR [Vallitaleaceae bacterium]|nr:protein-glutamate O-methyltransferase CheR [Vallitaleaceae bacterium]